MKKTLYFITILLFISTVPVLAGTISNANQPSGIFISFVPMSSGSNTVNAITDSGFVTLGTGKVTSATSAQEIRMGVASITTDLAISPLQALIIANEIAALPQNKISPFIERLRKKVGKILSEGKISENTHVVVEGNALLKSSFVTAKDTSFLLTLDNIDAQRRATGLGILDINQENKNSCSNKRDDTIENQVSHYDAHPTPVDDLLSSLPIWTQMSLDAWDKYQSKNLY